MNSNFLKHVSEIDQLILQYYALPTPLNICDFVRIGNENLGSLLIQEANNECLMAICYHESIVATASNQRSLKSLFENNLAHFLVISEEISHFRFLEQKIANQQSTTQVQIEKQGEMDKVMLILHCIESFYNLQNYLFAKNIVFNNQKIHITQPNESMIYELSTRKAFEALSKLESKVKKSGKRLTLQNLRNGLRSEFLRGHKSAA